MQTQWFINCAHINVIGPGGGTLDGYPFAKFPGSYDYMDSGKPFRLLLQSTDDAKHLIIFTDLL